MIFGQMSQNVSDFPSDVFGANFGDATFPGPPEDALLDPK